MSETLRHEREQGLDRYYRQYIADQEKLFNTSRSLTVNEMATTLAHELNQPIGTVINLLHGCIDRLQEHNTRYQEQRVSSAADAALSGVSGTVHPEVLEALDFAIRQAQFASQIIARIREFTEARQPRVERLDLVVLVEESVQLLDWVITSENIELRVEAQHSPLVVACDRMLLQQVLVNLCRNAIEAMREIEKASRCLQVRLFRSEDGVHVEISDTGPGIADESISEMFKPFVSSKRDGMGVGLNICRSFVELHQGRLWITRNRQNGCTVHIRLPEE